MLVYGVTLLVNPYVSNLFNSAAGSGVGFELLLGGLGLIFVLRKYPQGIAGAVQAWWQGRLDAMAAETDERVVAAADAPVLALGDLRLAFGDAPPMAAALGVAEMTVQHRDIGAAAAKAGDSLRRQADFRHENQRFLAAPYHFFDGSQIDFGLAAAGHAVQ